MNVTFSVIPATAGIQILITSEFIPAQPESRFIWNWIPTFAGMTKKAGPHKTHGAVADNKMPATPLRSLCGPTRIAVIPAKAGIQILIGSDFRISRK
ncbi:MAG: hypothetical protein ACRETQ_10620 [Gammaproteobacteria bacterium]